MLHTGHICCTDLINHWNLPLQAKYPISFHHPRPTLNGFLSLLTIQVTLWVNSGLFLSLWGYRFSMTSVIQSFIFRATLSVLTFKTELITISYRLDILCVTCVEGPLWARLRAMHVTLTISDFPNLPAGGGYSPSHFAEEKTVQRGSGKQHS